MRKLALLLAVLICLTSCHKPDIKNTFKIVTGASSSEAEEPLPEPSSSTEPEDGEDEKQEEDKKEAPVPKEPEIKEPEEPEIQEPEEPEPPSSKDTSAEDQAKAASEAAASEAAARAASEAAAFEAAQKAAAEAAAAQEAQKAAAEAAAFEAQQRAAAEAAAAQEAQRAAAEAAAAQEAQRAAEEAQRAATEAAAAQEAQRAAAKKTPAKKASASGKNFLSDIESEVLALQNQERARQGLPALQYDPELQNAARIRSRELCQAGVFAHTRPDGRQWNTVLIEDVPYDYLSAGENLAIVESTDPNIDLPEDPDFWVDGWIDSPPHYKNMIRAEYNRAGVGIYKVVRNGETCAIATTIFSYVDE